MSGADEVKNSGVGGSVPHAPPTSGVASAPGASIRDSAPSNVPASSSSSSSSKSYVYPVRSLLSGIQPARHEQVSAAEISGSIGGVHLGPMSISQAAAQLKRERDFRNSQGTRSARGSLSEGNIIFPTDPPFVPLSGEGYFAQPTQSTAARSNDSIPKSPLQQQGAKSGEKHEERYEVPAARHPGSAPSSPLNPPGHENEQRVLILPGDRDADEYDPRHPEPISSAGADVLATAYTTPALSLRMPQPMQPASADEPAHSKPIDFSQSGIVHLPPLSSRGDSDRGSSVSGGSFISSRQARTNVQSPFSGSGSDPWGRSDRGKSSGGEGVQSGLSGTDSAGEMQGATGSTTNLSSSSELVTFRFDYVVDENGYHVLTGREGTLAKCEDEV